MHHWDDVDICRGVDGEGGEPQCSPWAMQSHYHLVFAHPRALADPIPYKGRLGLWTLPDDVLGGAA